MRWLNKQACISQPYLPKHQNPLPPLSPLFLSRLFDFALCCCHHDSSSSSSSSSDNWRWDSLLKSESRPSILSQSSPERSLQRCWNCRRLRRRETTGRRDWNWDRWQKHFDEIDSQERLVSILKTQIETQGDDDDDAAAAATVGV
ncbi:hypothetical protein CMV_005787 [Castanea mollissima]|uniref:Uncharacterized protein n=1 Tax=Castanea mollissima TaxID=60419 RepID=A0A8J4RWJ7_9ROSI|nr:hypothetical protein CMV_005787 [Castanea mollissima]